MSAHTPLPWRCDAGDIESTAALEVVAQMDYSNDDWEANAALIVEAVNNYETIRAELDEVKRLYSETERSNMSLGEAICTIDEENQLLRSELDAVKALENAVNEETL